MNRRKFLKYLGIGTAVTIVPLEAVASPHFAAKASLASGSIGSTLKIGKPAAYTSAMTSGNITTTSNTLMSPDLITKEALRVLHQKLRFIN